MSRPTSSASNKSFHSAKSHNSAGSKNSATSKTSAASKVSDSSYASAFSADSYVAKLTPGLDDAFEEMIKEVGDLGTSLQQERKAQSHISKRRDPNDLQKRTWTDAMQKEYKAYKDAVDRLGEAKAKHEASTKAAKASVKKPAAEQEAARLKALEDDRAWLDRAVDATTARLGFMQKYPDAFNTPIHKTHLIAAQDNMNSAKQALREINTQETKISDIHKIEAAKAARAGKGKEASSKGKGRAK
ncbi:uncharacterized protein B0H64DRAFT_86206 [Chaetomium fimeti]|uniref:Uncharacterized protein n=1 Tax=Chaetomium fimeti TaxID=1854472 RepID=A0AAE0HLX3_9PEZI|nr:hypothetical protein B0H64DRAFT_86206 [Chaetomium fimeti]